MSVIRLRKVNAAVAAYSDLNKAEKREFLDMIPEVVSLLSDIDPDPPEE